MCEFEVMTKTTMPIGSGHTKLTSKGRARGGQIAKPAHKRTTGAGQEELFIRRAVKHVVRIHREALQELEKY